MRLQIGLLHCYFKGFASNVLIESSLGKHLFILRLMGLKIRINARQYLRFSGSFSKLCREKQ